MPLEKGITDYSLHIPYYRLKRKTIINSMGWFNPGLAALGSGDKAVANWDEDSLTMAVAAARGCFTFADKSETASLYLASTTLPYAERSNAGIAAAAINLPPQVKTAELGGSTKSGLTALDAALKEDVEGKALVIASDSRLGKAGGTNEILFGDGAAAFCIGKDRVIASYKGSYSLSCDFADYRRFGGDRYVKSWEERWIRDEGYMRFIPQAVENLLKESGLKADEVDKFVFPPLSGRDHAGLAKSMGLGSDQVQDHFMDRFGNTGTAHPLIMLIAALERSEPGQRILVCGYGGGCEAVLFQVTEAINDVKGRGLFQANLDYSRELASYSKYLSFKKILDKEKGIRGEEVAPTSLSLTCREQDTIIRLIGGRCLSCGTPQFPRDRICVNPDCKEVDQMEPYSFSDRIGHLFTYTADHLAYSEDPPALYGMVDFEGGGRYWFDLTDCTLDSLNVGQPVQMSFRRKYIDEARSLSGYFWKAVPFKG